MTRVVAMVMVMLAMAASAAVDVCPDARASWREGVGQKTQWAPTGKFSGLNARAVFAGESRRAASPYAGEDSETAAGGKEAGFTGHRFESALGLTYAEQRWLDSTTGSFLSRDPVGAGSYLVRPNELYAFGYAAGNPARFVDPDGRCLPGMTLGQCVAFDSAFLAGYLNRRNELGFHDAASLVTAPLRALDQLVECATQHNPVGCRAFRFTITMDPAEKEELARLYAESVGWAEFKEGFAKQNPVMMGRGMASMQHEVEQFANMLAGAAVGAASGAPVASPAPALPVPSRPTTVPMSPGLRRLRLAAGGVNNPTKAAIAKRRQMEALMKGKRARLSTDIDEPVAAAKPSVGAAPSTPPAQLSPLDDLVEAAKPTATRPPEPTTAPAASGTGAQRMFGSQGTQLTSKTIWKGRDGMRIDVENPNPGQRPGQIHFQQGDAKYLYDPGTGKFVGAPRAVNDLASTAELQEAITKGLRFLGEVP
jgi:RHS repeat-associated protein